MPVRKKYRDYHLRFKCRVSLPKYLKRGAVCAELGVSRGSFSRKILGYEHISKLYSIDRWDNDRGHTDNQYQRVAKSLGKFGDRSEVIRSSFEDAVHRFKDNYFDFIYIDGYAHEGYLPTLQDWWPKLKKFGLFAVHDYHPKWMNNVRAIDKFCYNNGISAKNICARDRYWTFWTIK